MFRRIVLAAAALGLVGSPSAAQSRQTVSLQISGLVTSINGPSFENFGLSSAVGGEVQLRVNINPGDLSIGGGVQMSSHSGRFNATDSKVKLTGLFLEPRYAIRTSSRTLRPYLAGRLAFLKQALSYSTVAVTARGTAIGAGGGFAVRLAPKLNFDLGAAITTANFGEYQDDGQGTGEDAGSGSSFVIKAGLTIGLGK